MKDETLLKKNKLTQIGLFSKMRDRGEITTTDLSRFIRGIITAEQLLKGRK